MDERGFEQLLGRGIDVIELTADGATNEEMTALAEALDEVESEQKAAEVKSEMRRAGLLW